MGQRGNQTRNELVSAYPRKLQPSEPQWPGLEAYFLKARRISFQSVKLEFYIMWNNHKDDNTIIFTDAIHTQQET